MFMMDSANHSLKNCDQGILQWPGYLPPMLSGSIGTFGRVLCVPYSIPSVYSLGIPGIPLSTRTIILTFFCFLILWVTNISTILVRKFYNCNVAMATFLTGSK